MTVSKRDIANLDAPWGFKTTHDTVLGAVGEGQWPSTFRTAKAETQQRMEQSLMLHPLLRSKQRYAGELLEDARVLASLGMVAEAMVLRHRALMVQYQVMRTLAGL